MNFLHYFNLKILFKLNWELRKKKHKNQDFIKSLTFRLGVQRTDKNMKTKSCTHQ